MLHRLHCRHSLRLVAAVAARKDTMEQLHTVFNHASMELIEDLACGKVDFSFKFKMADLSLYEWVPCIPAKLKRATYMRDPERKRWPFEKLSVELRLINQHIATSDKPFPLVVGEATWYKWCYLLADNDEAVALLMNLLRRLSTEFRSKGYGVANRHSYQGAELQGFCERRGIAQLLTNAYPPEENGLVKRANDMVLPRLRALLHAATQTNSR